MTKNPLAKRLENHKIILASGSPRRKKFFEDLGIPFEIRLQAVEEQYPNELKEEEISNFLAELKSTPFLNDLRSDEILITSDTVVWCNGDEVETENHATTPTYKETITRKSAPKIVVGEIKVLR